MTGIANVSLNSIALPFLEFAEQHKELAEHKAVAYQILRNFTLEVSGYDPVDDVISRAVASEMPAVLTAVPADPKIIEKILGPLRAARVSFCLGHYGACIAMAGTACEMAALFIHSIVDESNASSWMKQGKRLEKLAEFSEVPVAFIEHAESVRVTRNDYLHVLSSPQQVEECAALAAFQAAMLSIDALFGLRSGDVPGALYLPDGLVKDYLKNQGVVTSLPEES